MKSKTCCSVNAKLQLDLGSFFDLTCELVQLHNGFIQEIFLQTLAHKRENRLPMKSGVLALIKQVQEGVITKEVRSFLRLFIPPPFCKVEKDKVA